MITAALVLLIDENPDFLDLAIGEPQHDRLCVGCGRPATAVAEFMTRGNLRRWMYLCDGICNLDLAVAEVAAEDITQRRSA